MDVIDDSTPDDRTVPAPDRRTLRRAVVAAGIGNVVEWFDYVAYAYVATAIARNFFPADDPVAALLSTFAVLALASFVRPLGGMVFGPLADRIGRRPVLALTVLLISGSSFLIGLLPGYATIGVAAPVLLVLLRLVQGFSVGGEHTSAATFIAEYAPRRRRGLLTSFLLVGTLVGFLGASILVTVLTTVMTPVAFDSWGWRIPFLIAAPLGLVGLFLRSKLEDTPVFREARAAGEVVDSPLREGARSTARTMLVLIGVLAVVQVGNYTLLTYLPTFMTSVLKVARSQSLLVVTIGIAVSILVIPLAGAWSDRVGRKLPMRTACIGLIVLSYPAFLLISQATLPTMLAGAAILAVLLGITLGASPAQMVEIFPTRVRSASTAVSYNLSVAVFGGLTPFGLAAVIAATGNSFVPAYYLILASVLSFVALYFIAETAGRSMRGTGTVPDSRGRTAAEPPTEATQS
jgi:MHS family proline/betaine transporter-like MFS transporter